MIFRALGPAGMRRDILFAVFPGSAQNLSSHAACRKKKTAAGFAGNGTRTARISCIRRLVRMLRRAAGIVRRQVPPLPFFPEDNG